MFHHYLAVASEKLDLTIAFYLIHSDLISPVSKNNKIRNKTIITNGHTEKAIRQPWLNYGDKYLQFIFIKMTIKNFELRFFYF